MRTRRFEDHAPEVGANVFIDDSAVVLGQVTIGEDSSVWPHCTLRGDVNTITIGRRTNVQDGSVFHTTGDSPHHPGGSALLVGEEVTVGHRVILHGCTVGDRCLIGMGAIVLDGAVLGEGVLLGAGSLVPPGRELEGGYLWLGSPVRRVRALTEQERAALVESADHYVRLKDRHLKSL